MHWNSESLIYLPREGSRYRAKSSSSPLTAKGSLLDQAEMEASCHRHALASGACRKAERQKDYIYYCFDCEQEVTMFRSDCSFLEQLLSSE